jgi:hypothetical protein
MAHGGDYLLLQGRIIGVSAQHRGAFDALSQPERDKFYGQLALEIAKAKILFNSDISLDHVSVEKWIPITSKLTASDLVEGINDIRFSADIIWNTIALRLGERLQLTQESPTGPAGPTGPSASPSTQPSSTRDTGASRPSQA